MKGNELISLGEDLEQSHVRLEDDTKLIQKETAETSAPTKLRIVQLFLTGHKLKNLD
jgi:hypothetical protein